MHTYIFIFISFKKWDWTTTDIIMHFEHALKWPFMLNLYDLNSLFLIKLNELITYLISFIILDFKTIKIQH